MSDINTNGLDVNYPIPGVNNSSQGFRDNFNNIKNNLDTAQSELTDIQLKAVVKSALIDTSVNNDMANTLISNASVRSFRATTYPLGNDLSGLIVVDVSLGDVQYGTITGDTQFQFGNWAPTGTQSNVKLQLTVANVEAVISFPSEVVATTNDYGITTLENVDVTSGYANIIVPNDVSQLNYELSTLDCGNSISIVPVNRPRQTTQIFVGTPSSNIGAQGDRAGTTMVNSTHMYVCTADYDGSTAIWKRITLSSY